ncbi:sporulation protein YqfD [Clostridium tunisiense]|uniref:sporulation protein YqfD n=1 Tax=Clostridium tunisiense TaxID=219748 RepID=UPI0002F8D21B|nr:sporulation protein YqfD [Clostridium tunisiense]
MSSLTRYRKSYITVEVQTLNPEKILNYLWKHEVQIKNIKKNNVASMTLEIRLCDYKILEEIVRKTHSKIKIEKRRGVTFLLLKLRGRKVLLGGVLVFFGILYYLSSFIWKIEIVTKHHLTPLELRMLVKNYGITPGIKKSTLNVEDLEDNIVKDTDEVMWVKARIEGSKLSIEVVERQAPPKIKEQQLTGNIVAKMDGVIERVYTTSGTAVTEPGKIVKKGDLLVKGEQGKEGKVYTIKAEGKVYARTFYEETAELPMTTVEEVRTGKILKNYYVTFKDKKYYLKNSLNNFEFYDKIENNRGIINSDVYYEVNQNEKPTDPEVLAKELENKIRLNLDKSVKIIEVTPKIEKLQDKYLIKVLIIAEEDIGVDEVVSNQ